MKIKVKCYNCKKEEIIVKDYTEEHIEFLKNYYMCQDCYTAFLKEIRKCI